MDLIVEEEEEEGETRMDAGIMFMAGSDLESTEGLLEFDARSLEKVKPEQVDPSGDDEEEEEDGWEEHDSFPEFPPGEVPDFLSGERNVLGSARPTVPLYKHRSWSANDSYREEAWLRRKEGSTDSTRSKSVTDEDLDELRGCIDLGFRFYGKEDRSLSDTIPALDLYYAVNRQYADCISRSPASDCSGSSSSGSPQRFFGPGDSPQLVKTRLRQWAQVVACAVRNSR